MTFTDHWKELRTRLFCATFLFLILFIIFFTKGTGIFEEVLRIGEEAGYEFIWLAPQEVLVQQLRLDLLAACICAIPFLVFQMILFAVPAFDKKRTAVICVICELFMLFLFGIGVIFALKILLPFCLNYLYGLASSTTVAAQLAVNDYVSFVIILVVVLGCVVELPVICSLLVANGIIETEVLKKARVGILIASLTLAAIITPPDIISQCMVGLPIYLLYEISIIISKIIEIRKRGK